MDKFLSEVHLESCPPGEGEWITEFVVDVGDSDSEDGGCIPHGASSDGAPVVDADGDLVVKRRPTRKRISWRIRHFRKTALKDVGTQVWRGACLMAEFILSRRDLFYGKTILELGCGVGLLGIALGTIPHSLILSDANTQALTLAEENLKANLSGADAVWKIRHLNWSQPPKFLFGAEDCTQRQARFDFRVGTAKSSSLQALLQCVKLHPVGIYDIEVSHIIDQGADLYCQQDGISCFGGNAHFDWCQSDMAIMRQIDTFLAADVVFDDNVTDAFVACLHAFFEFSVSHGNEPKCYLGLEKRINFTIEDLEARAPAYDHLMKFVSRKECHQEDAKKLFVGHPVAIGDVPQVTFLAKPNGQLCRLLSGRGMHFRK